MNKKSKKIIITLLILLLVLVFIISIIVLVLKEYENIESSSESRRYENYMKDKVIPSGSYYLALNYDGDIDEEEYYINLLEVVNYISDLSNNKIKNVDKYFNNNKQKILQCFGINNLEDFKKLVEYLNSKGEISKFQKAVIDSESVKNTTFYTKFNLKLIYLNDVSLDFEVHFMDDEYSGYIAEYIL